MKKTLPILLSLLAASHGYATVDLLDPAFGVTGDGVTDDTAAIQAVIEHAEATRQSVWIPAAPGGFYKITDELILDFPGLIIEGEGFAVESRSKIRQTNVNKHAFKISYPVHSPSNHYLVLRNFAVEGPGASVSLGDGFNLILPEGKFNDQIYLENMRISYFRNGFQADHLGNSTLSNVTFDGNYNGFVIGGNANAINLNGCWIGNNLNACMILTGSGGITVRGTAFSTSPRLLKMAPAAWTVWENCSAELITGPSPDGTTIAAAIEMDTNAYLALNTFKIQGGGGNPLPLIRANYGVVHLHEIRMSGYATPVVALDRTIATNAAVSHDIAISPNTPTVRIWSNASYNVLRATYKNSLCAIVPEALPTAAENLRGTVIDVFSDQGDYKSMCVRKANGTYAWVQLTN